MSNCIEFPQNPWMGMTADDIDVEKFWQAIQNCDDERPSPQKPGMRYNEVTEAQWKEYSDWYIPHWFLVPDLNVELTEEGHILIGWGQGRSIHTYRDLDQTIRFINQFIKRPNVWYALAECPEIPGRYQHKFEFDPKEG